MSQGDSEDSTASGWLGGWIQTAKEKSSSVLDVVKRDLAEFSSTMQHDGSNIAATVKDKLTQENASAATQKVRDGVSSFLGGISKALVIAPDDEYQLMQIVGGQAVVFDRYKARLHAIQTAPTTYTTEPTPVDSYRDWLAGFDVETWKGNISELLVSNVEIRALYTQLVPLTVSNLDFWSRYYFRCHQLDVEEARRVELMRRADECQGQKDMRWDEDDDDDDWTQVSADSHTAVTADQRVAPDNDTASPAAAGGPSAGHDSVGGPTQSASAASPAAATTPPSSSSDAAAAAAVGSSSTGETASADDVTGAPAESVGGPSTDQESLGGPSSGQDSVGGPSACQEFVGGPSTDQGSMGGPSTDQESVASSASKTDSLVVVPERTSPSDDSSNAKESLDEDWEKDFDVEVTQQELEAAKERLRTNSAAAAAAAAAGDDAGKAAEDWEDW